MIYFNFVYKSKLQYSNPTNLVFFQTGFFNILIYTRPKVQALRKIIDISRIEGFIVVIVAGGETPNVMDYIYSSDHPQDVVNPELAPFKNSVLERACRVFGYSFDEGYRMTLKRRWNER